MKIIFMGTPDFSVPALEALVKEGHQVAAVVTQPDKPKGRGKAVLMTPVKEKADVIVVVAFGQILPKAILEIPRYGCINIHASLLPKYRGAAPIQWVIIDGERETGITTMYMNEGLDTGDMLEKVIIPLDAKETGGSLHDKLAAAGADLILSTLTGLENVEKISGGY